ncbi:uncharacterized protein EI90DRAFT_3000716 [Cantharellus anzutake]|uniref:uncharacterized protein n=1 Tax=Cantharellus anzutake TaxID=1750568 RepID=UPI001903AB5F|nr:uncharacterized protein EI90DRAFT_3000716 [Cantharellus anzutake]KAF8324282.1 hypothetical protein EI90DRAFT_3000716 [Cantharellus anzutake]
MKLKEIQRTATFAWSPSSRPTTLIVTGTVAGALDASFSNESQLEIWDPDFMNKSEAGLGGAGQRGPIVSVTTGSRFNRLVWGAVGTSRPRGVIAAGMENGEVNIWDPEKIVSNAEPSEYLISRNTEHTSSVRALDFNPLQSHLLSSGGGNAEIYVWDLENPNKPYTPGAKSSKLDEITSLAWNHQVAHVLATSSTSGYTVVWDLRGKREVTALQYGGGAGTTGGSTVYQGGGVLALGNRRGMSAIAWHPDNATRLITASEDDSSPIIMVWDLRNSRAPEKILTGHEKGVLSLAWCKQDPDLLLSCGKDNRALIWNPQTSETIGELPAASNWAFQVEWSPRNPDMFASAFFDGTIGIHSLQTTNEPSDVTPVHGTVSSSGADLFDQPSSATSQAPLSLRQPPKWLRRPSSGSFGFGGKLVTVSNLPSAQGANQSRVVHLRTVATEPSIVESVNALKDAEKCQTLKEFAALKSSKAHVNASDVEAASWKALSSLFSADSRDELVTLLGFSKAEVATQVAEASKTLKAGPPRSRPLPRVVDGDSSLSVTEGRTYVSFAEPEKEVQNGERESEDTEAGSEGRHSSGAPEATPSEVSGSAMSDFTKATEPESTATEPSLFGDDVAVGTPQTEAAADFFSSMGTIRNAVPERVLVPHHSYAADSSVAATIGSRASSVISEPLRGQTFKIYPTDELDTDRLITKSLVLGDFESAVTLCLSADRFADAILLAARGGPDLLQRTQTTYFERHTTALPYLRLFQSVVTNDLADVVQNADLSEWKEIFVVVCTFARAEEFASLAEQLGQRLEFQSQLLKSSEGGELAHKSRELRKNAVLCYLVAGKLDKLANIWVEELSEEESQLNSDAASTSSRYANHARALQSFIEKVAVFRGATKFVDVDLNISPVDSDEVQRTYKLSELYNRYYEYADLLAAQGLLGDAVKYIKLTPVDYKGPSGSQVDFEIARDQLLRSVEPSTPAAPKPISQASIHAPALTANATPSSSYSPYSVPPAASTLANGPYQPSQIPPFASNIPYGSQFLGPQAAGPSASADLTSIIPPPPVPITSSGGTQSSIAPPPPKKDIGGWNDAPAFEPPARKLPPSTVPSKTPASIASPFPNSSPYSGPGSPSTPPPPFRGPGAPRGQTPPPPPRAGSNQGSRAPPPPPASQPAFAPPPPRSSAFQGAPPRPGSAGPSDYPPRIMSPLNPATTAGNTRPPAPRRSPYGPPAGQPAPVAYQQQTARAVPPPGQYAPPVVSGPPPSGFGRGTPPPAAVPANYGPPPSGPGSRLPPPPTAGAPPTASPPTGLRQAPPPAGNVASPTPAPAPPPARAAPPPPKYPPGDRSHIPVSDKPILEYLSGEIARLKQTTPPQQKRVADDTERRVNALFEALNAQTLSRPVVDQLASLVQSMQARDQHRALAQHVDLLTSGSRTDDIALWMSGVKQLIIRL